MALDHTKTVYKQRKDVSPRSSKTSYSHMSRWIDSMEGPYPRPTISVNHFGNGNLSPAFTGRKKPWIQPKSPDTDRKPAEPQPDLAQEAAIDPQVPVHLRYSHNCGYDDFHKAFRAISNQWPSSSYPTFGPPRLRHGRQGGSWRHVKEVLQAGGSRVVFVDGRTTLDDRYRMEETPGGGLIVGTEGERPEDFAAKEAKRTAWIANYRREKDRHPNMKLAMYGSLDTKKAVEKTNWFIMR